MLGCPPRLRRYSGLPGGCSWFGVLPAAGTCLPDLLAAMGSSRDSSGSGAPVVAGSMERHRLGAARLNQGVLVCSWSSSANVLVRLLTVNVL